MMKTMFGHCLSGSTGTPFVPQPPTPQLTSGHMPGLDHAKQRKMLNPVFSVKHMRHMLPLFWELGHKVRHSDSLAGDRHSR